MGCLRHPSSSNVRQRTCVRKLASSGAAVATVAVDPLAGGLVAAGRADGSVAVWDLRGTAFAPEQQPLAVWSYHSGECRGLDFSPDARFLATAGFDGRVSVIDLDHTSTEAVHVAELDGKATQVKFHPTACVLATAGADQAVRLWSV